MIGPNHRDLYLIIIGILLGLMLSPAVLGRVSPTTYDRLFRGGGDVERQIQAHHDDVYERRQRLLDTGVSPEAVEEFDSRPHEALVLLEAQLQQARRDHRMTLLGRGMAMLMAILAVMVVETLVDPRALMMRSRLATARYGLVALWLAMMLATPTLFRLLPVPFLVGLIIVALAAALVPLSESGRGSHT